ncbi:disulfide bond formation protein DsbA [Corynebacterium sp. CCM 9203]|uniref:mycothiol-dependent nitroreductase Rv2466c family protein n=1 Tax=Corynebacterium sp. CCM 9203 TaxID=3057615 RepID=UPI0035265489
MSQPMRFWFDVTCPYAWITSRWAIEVEKVRDVEITWIPMSLGVLNQGRDELPEDYRRRMTATWAPARVFARVATEYPDKVGELYTVLGTKIHNEGQGAALKENAGDGDISDLFIPLIREALTEVGLDEGVADTGLGSEWDDVLKDFHGQAMSAVGDEVGTPVVEVSGTAFFGPVLTRIPRGDDAGMIFDGAVALAGYPHFFELKRSRTERPDFT